MKKHNKQKVKEGAKAFKDGKSDSSCPYPSNNNRKSLNSDRYAWMAGYYFAFSKSNLKTKGIEIAWED